MLTYSRVALFAALSLASRSGCKGSYQISLTFPDTEAAEMPNQPASELVTLGN